MPGLETITSLSTLTVKQRQRRSRPYVLNLTVNVLFNSESRFVTGFKPVTAKRTLCNHLCVGRVLRPSINFQLAEATRFNLIHRQTQCISKPFPDFTHGLGAFPCISHQPQSVVCMNKFNFLCSCFLFYLFIITFMMIVFTAVFYNAVLFFFAAICTSLCSL